MRSILDCLLNFWEETDKRKASGKDLNGFSTGLPRLDRETDGFCGGDYWIIAAESGIGKTTLALNLAFSVCKQGGTVLYVISEMSELRCTERILSMKSGIDYYTLRHPKYLTETQHAHGYETSTKLSRLPFYLHAQNYTVDDIDAMVTQGDVKFDVIFVDYLQDSELCKGVDFVSGTQTESFNLKTLAKSQNKCVVALSQYSYSGTLKGSSAIKQNADNVIALTRDHDDETKKKILNVKIEKARYGNSGSRFECIFNLNTGKIFEREINNEGVIK